jgi:starch phosphorylase
MTNGVTPRRWLAQANPGLAALLDQHLGQRLAARPGPAGSGCAPHADDARLPAAPSWPSSAPTSSAWPRTSAHTGVVDPASLFDVQVKRIHEYKRQLLNVLHVVTRYQAMLADPQADWVPRTVIFAGKAASSYTWPSHHPADPRRGPGRQPRPAHRRPLKVVFVPNYGVSVAEVIMPGADLSEQISTAGTEASGTGNMKLALNGALTIGTDDGANIEIRQNRSATTTSSSSACHAEVAAQRAAGYQPLRIYEQNPRSRACSTPSPAACSRPKSRGATGRWSIRCCGAATTTCCWPTTTPTWPRRRVDALYRTRGLGAQGHRQRGRHGPVLGRPHDPRVRARDLARLAPQAC